ncbi:MAG: AMP-binding protein, partial [Pirellulaceae bacterium]|nr:AMP-binding protein [Pirellulaceae bacterium]
MRRWKNNKFYRWRKPLWLLPPLAQRAAQKQRLHAKRGHVSEHSKPTCYTLNYPDTTLGKLIDQSAARFGDARAIVYGDAQWTYAELYSEVNRLAAGMAGLGVRRGDRVLLGLPNCPEFVQAFLAIQKLGAIVVNAGPLIGADDLEQVRAMTQPKLAVALDLQATRMGALQAAQTDLCCVLVSLQNYQTGWKRLGYRAKLIQAQSHNGCNGRARRLEDLLAHAPSRPPTVAPDPDETAVLQPTGGTTGRPKIAQLSHRNLLSNAMQLSVWGQQAPGQDRVLALLPMFHVYGLTTCLITPVFNAATILPLTRFHVAKFLDVICAHRPTVLPLAPAIIEPMCDALAARPRAGLVDALRGSTVTSGAAPLQPRTARRFEELTSVRVVQGYGLTEASPATHLAPPQDPRDR